jgi:hypothetical protein
LIYKDFNFNKKIIIKTIIEFELNEHINTVRETLKSIPKELELAANIYMDSLKNGKKDGGNLILYVTLIL